MRAFGITGHSGSGKTTLIEALLRAFAGRMRVSVIKHTHHDFDLDQPGKDSHRFRSAGATEVMLVGARRWALLREQAVEADALASQLGRLDDTVDLVLVEGFRASPLPKLEVWREATAREPRFAGDPSIVAIAVDGRAPDGCGLPVFQLNDAGAIADFVMTRAVAPGALPC